MPEYLLLLYANETVEKHDPCVGDPLWQAVMTSLGRAGLLVTSNQLHSATTATTVRVRGGETELTDGPFAMTKEVLAGYFVLNCVDLDEALHHAARLPIAHNGSVEVRPIMDMSEIPAFGPGAAPGTPVMRVPGLT